MEVALSMEGPDEHLIHIPSFHLDQCYTRAVKVGRRAGFSEVVLFVSVVSALVGSAYLADCEGFWWGAVARSHGLVYGTERMAAGLRPVGERGRCRR